MYEDHPEGCSARYHESALCTCGVRFAAQHPGKKAENTHGIAGEAHDLVYGARAATYGHPRLDFTIIANVWTGLLQDKLKDGERLDPYRVAVMMTGLKLARLVKSPGHHDSRADTIGYMLTMERLDEPEPILNKLADDPDFMGYGGSQKAVLDWVQEKHDVRESPREPYQFPSPVMKPFQTSDYEGVPGPIVPGDPNWREYVFPYAEGLDTDATTYKPVKILARNFKEAQREFDKLLGRETAGHSAQLDMIQENLERRKDHRES